MDDEEWRNPHCVATVLKMYLNELPTCLFTEEKYFSFVEMFKGKLFLLVKKVARCEMKFIFNTARSLRRDETRRDDMARYDTACSIETTEDYMLTEFVFEKVDCSLSEQNRLLCCCQEDILKSHFYICTCDF